MAKIVDTIIHADVLDGLKQIPDESVSLMATSPPYNTSITYGNHDDEMPWDVYLNWLKDVWTECARTLRPGGRLSINIDAITNWDEDRDKEYVRPIYAEMISMMRDIPGMNFRTEICWYKQNAVGRKTAWGSYMSCSNPIVRRNHEYLLVWSKGDWGLTGDAEESDMTKEEFELWTLSTWFIQPETMNLGGHPVPFPEELCKRLIKLFTYRGDTVLDPFSGSGTTCYVSKLLNRHYIGIDNEMKYVKYARNRIAALDRELFEDDYVPRSQRMAENKSKKKSKKKQDIFDA